MPQPVQVLPQLEDAPLVDAQPLPHGVPALNGGVEGADPGLVTVDQLTVDVDEKIGVARVERLLHRRSPISTTRSPASNSAIASIPGERCASTQIVMPRGGDGPKTGRRRAMPLGGLLFRDPAGPLRSLWS